MIVRSGQPVTLRDIFDRFGLISIQRRVRRYCRPYLKRQKHTFATLGVWSFLSDLAGRNEVLLYDGPEQSRRFCEDCREDTAHACQASGRRECATSLSVVKSIGCRPSRMACVM